MAATYFEISDKTLDIPSLNASMRDRTAGALASFEGWVRDHNDGRQVDGLDYEVFKPLAQSEGEAILDEARRKFHVTGIRAVHRHGMLTIGDCAVWVGATSAHRDEAFRACRHVIDEIKHRLPIWKKEHYRDGSAEWVNCQHPGATHERDHLPHAPAFAEADLYARQIRLPEIGAAGQARLKAARVLIVGAGGLGSPAALMLAAAGIGTIGIVEFDRLEPSNLHRQILYAAADVGRPKAALAAERLKAQNPFIEVAVHATRADAGTLPSLFAAYDIVLDCTDNFTARYLLADAAILFGKPLVQASIHRFEGQLLTIDAASPGGCLRCLWPEPPAEGMIGNCAEIGVLGVVPGLFGTLQASEALKIILGLPGILNRHLLIMDALTLVTRRIARQKDAGCPLCGDQQTIYALSEPQRPDPKSALWELEPGELTGDMLEHFRLVDLREPEERVPSPLPLALQWPFSGFDPANPPFDGATPVLLICGRGVRSGLAAEQLRARGMTEVYSLLGGAPALARLGRQAAE